MPRENISLEVIHGTLMGLSSKMDTFITEQISIKAKLEELSTSQEFISSQFDQFQDTLKKVIQKQKDADENLIQHNKTIADLTFRLNALEQYSRNTSIEIREVKKTENEDVEKIIIDIAQKMNIALIREDIQAAHRLPAPDGKNQAIIANLNSRKKRDQILSFKGTITNNSLFGGDSRGKIFIGESLSPYFKELLWKTKMKAKTCNYKFVWFRKSNILARRDEKAPVITIRSSEDLEKMTTKN